MSFKLVIAPNDLTDSSVYVLGIDVFPEGIKSPEKGENEGVEDQRLRSLQKQMDIEMKVRCFSS